METFFIEHYTIEVETKEYTRPGDQISVTIRSNRQNAKFISAYALLMYPGESAKDLAQRAFIHYKMGTKPDEKRPK